MAAYAPPPSRPAVHAPNPRMVPPAGPPGTLAPGTKIQVGSHRVTIEKYLSEGGFAHVYVVRVPMPDGSHEQAVLKRVAVPDKEQLATMRTEVETMKKLKGHKHIVTYMDSHASQLKGGGYEVFLLMEWCSGGGLIDFMNTRLQNRLTEPEILKIISDASEGVACMHYLKPPLLHRDLKVENILISSGPTSTKKLYKLCDFGSTAPPRPAATNAAEGRLIEDDVQKHTTLQYRSPEMIDVYRKRPIDEKSDIWALGVLLYKLCYYTTPFEEQGTMAILTARFKYPAYPVFSDRLKLLIANMLAEDSKKRPNIYEVMCQICAMRGVDVPIKDIYAERTPSEVRRNQQLPPREPSVVAPPSVGASFQAPLPESKSRIPDITPMRRGRPTGTAQTIQAPPSTSQARRIGGDPFAALDSSSVGTRSAEVDEIGSKFPALDDFSILQDKKNGFKFDAAKTQNGSAQPVNSLVTQALADEAFATLSTPPRSPGPVKTKPTVPEKSRKPESPRSRAESPHIKEPTPQRPTMVSTGTMTSKPSSPVIKAMPKVSAKEIWRVPTAPPKPLKSTNRVTRTPSYKNARPDEVEHLNRDVPEVTISSRPSLESLRPPAAHLEEPMHRSQSAGTRSRSSRDRIVSRSKLQHARRISEAELPEQPEGAEAAVENAEPAIEEITIASDLDYLRAMEEERAHKGQSTLHKHHKHASMPASTMSGSRGAFSGKLGDTFRRFESEGSPRRLPSPDGLSADDDHSSIPATERSEHDIRAESEEAIDETEELSPEVRREFERRQQLLEERRVAEAAATYRQRVADRGSTVDSALRAPAKSSRASAIQDRVKTLLEESNKAPPVRKTASGYGRFTETSEEEADIPPPESVRRQPPPIAQKKTAPPPSRPATSQSSQEPQATRVSALPTRAPTARPSAPPKPAGLRKVSAAPEPALPPVEDSLSGDSDDLESDFSKRYPSLSLEMVEKEISKVNRKPPRPASMRVRDV